VPCDNGCLECT